MGKTKNAVLGRIFRLRLPKRERKPTTTTTTKPKRTRRYGDGGTILAIRARLARSTEKIPREELQQLVQALDDAVNCSFDELTSEKCHWPVKGEGREIIYCGSRVARKSYCAHHYLQGTAPLSAKR